MNTPTLARRTGTALVVAALLAAPAAYGAESASLMAPSSGDLAGATPVALEGALARAPLAPSRDAVDFTFALDPNAPIDAAPTPHRADSRESFVDVSAAALRAGVDLALTAPGAVVRLNPAPGSVSAETLAPTAVVLVAANGKRFAGGTGMEQLATPEQLRAADLPFAEGTIAFRTSAAVGAGTVRLAVPELRGSGSWMVHVFEPQSDVTLRLRTLAMDHLHGQPLEVRASLRDGGQIVDTDSVEAFVTSPAGRAWPLDLTATDRGMLRGTLPLDAVEAATPGLWEVHLSARGTASGLAVARNARVAFAAAAPTAAIAGGVEIDRSEGLRIGVDVAVGTPSRFEVRGLLYGTDADGQLRPLAAGHAARWLSADGAITLRFDADLLDASGLEAPYALRDLRLVDQGRLQMLHRQAEALRIER